MILFNSIQNYKQQEDNQYQEPLQTTKEPEAEPEVEPEVNISTYETEIK